MEIEAQEPAEEPTPAATGELAESVENTETVEAVEETAPSEEGEKPKKGGFQRRIDTLTREKYEAQRQAEAYKEQLAQMQQNVEPNTPPKLEDYGYDEGLYMQAVQEWNQNSIRSYQEQQQQQQEQARQQAEQFDAMQRLNKKATEAQEKYPDFIAKVNSPELPPLAEINQAAYQAVLESDEFADVAYYLASNPAEIYEFANLSPIQAVRKVTQLETRLSAKPSPQTTPITPPSEVGGTAEASKNMSDLPIEEWMKRRNEQTRGK